MQQTRGATALRLASLEAQVPTAPGPASQEARGASTARLLAAQQARGTSTARSPAQLLRLNRHSLTNVMILGGSREDRLQLARAFHRESPNRTGTFVRIDCARDEHRLAAHLEELLWAGGATEADPIPAGAGGTLFLDSIGRLSPHGQRLLFELASRTGDVDASPRLGRVIVGNRDDLASEVASGRFSDALCDCLDKLRIQLEPGSA